MACARNCKSFFALQANRCVTQKNSVNFQQSYWSNFVVFLISANYIVVCLADGNSLSAMIQQQYQYNVKVNGKYATLICYCLLCYLSQLVTQNNCNFLVLLLLEIERLFWPLFRYGVVCYRISSVSFPNFCFVYYYYQSCPPPAAKCALARVRQF